MRLIDDVHLLSVQDLKARRRTRADKFAGLPPEEMFLARRQDVRDRAALRDRREPALYCNCKPQYFRKTTKSWRGYEA